MARPLPDLVLFVDECLGSVDVPTALRFGSRGWIVLTSDKRIRRRHAEMQALLRANVMAFVLTSGNLTGTEAGDALVKAYPRMQKLVRDHIPPFVASVTATGAIKLLTSTARRAAKKKHT